MRNTRADVVAAALRVLDEHGLEFCSMRRVAAELGVQPSALYHHVPDKQALLALMADEIVQGVAEAGACDGTPAVVAGAREANPDRGAVAAREVCARLREAMLSVRDGADVVATASAYRLGASALHTRLESLVGADGARTLLLYTFGHAQSTQTVRQAAEFAAVSDPTRTTGPEDGAELDASFARGIDIILAGLGTGSER